MTKGTKGIIAIQAGRANTFVTDGAEEDNSAATATAAVLCASSVAGSNASVEIDGLSRGE